MPKYLIVGQHSWVKNGFEWRLKYHNLSDAKWDYYEGDPTSLAETIIDGEYDKIFFMHWSYIVPDVIVNNYECICFHPTDLPYGRGGTPIQNLIKRGHTSTMLTAFRMTSELDAGPIYFKYPMSLAGTAQDIYERMVETAWKMIRILNEVDIEPKPQEDEPLYFSRRKPEESELSGTETLDETYDHIRMLSAEDYPHAFIEYGDYIIEFMEPSKATNSILANAVIYRKDDFND